MLWHESTQKTYETFYDRSTIVPEELQMIRELYLGWLAIALMTGFIALNLVWLPV
jgi:hypothetical protein